METKACVRCGQEKPVAEFYRADAVRGYLSSTCKACDRERGRRYYREHPEYAEKVRQTARERHQKTAEEKRADKAAYMRQYMAAHPEKREQANRRGRAWRAEHPETTEARRQYVSDWHKAHPVPRDRKRRNEMRSLYGIGPDDYRRMLAEQDGKCAICGSADSGKKKPPIKWGIGVLSIDHDHKTNVVRGLLCHTCNVRVGASERLLADIGLDGLMKYLARGSASKLENA